MRSTVFTPPYEVTLTTEKESWTQSSSIKGAIDLKDINGNDLDKDIDIVLSLSLGNIKKVKAKDENAFVNLQSIDLGQGSNHNPFEIHIHKNSPLTTKKESLYLIVESRKLDKQLCHLPLQVDAHPVISSIVSIFETYHRFKLKEFKNKKLKVEAVFTPPSASKELSSLDSFSILFEKCDECLKVDYEYKIKVLAAENGETKIDKKKKKISQELNNNNFLFSEDTIDQEFVKNKIEEILTQIKTPKIF